MKVLVIGSGGREHALAWQCAKTDYVEQVFVAPGNGGTALENKLTNVNIASDDIAGLIDFVKHNKIKLTIVGPEAPLSIGIVNAFKDENLTIFGPTKAAAQLETSKVFCKDFLTRHNIPTALYNTFTELAPAISYINQIDTPIVIKADGLAAGKGVIIANSKQEAIAATYDMLKAKRFGSAGLCVVIEEFLVGEEVSFIVMVDVNNNILPMATSQDHKALFNDNKGPNTGGMGAYSPAPIVSDVIFQNIMDKIINPTVCNMAAEGNAYSGFLYAGLIIDKLGEPKVLEYNCRFGDPEAQPIMMRLQSSLPQLCLLANSGHLDKATIKWNKYTSLGVVLVAAGYPNNYVVGENIELAANINTDNTKIFHAGTKIINDKILSSGGRVLCATALGCNVAEANKVAYKLLKKINWQGAYYRDDIGFKAIKNNS